MCEEIKLLPHSKHCVSLSQDLTKEERSAALIPRIKDAMAFGLDVLDAAFEKIDVNEANSESEDDDTTYVTEAILEPKVTSHVANDMM